jgi:lipopolysaccharide export system permease protein
MLKIIDRQMVRGYFKAYLVCLTSLLSLYIVVDLFTNLDSFAKPGQALVVTVQNVATYYAYNAFQIFDRLCEVIVLLAAMFTVALMQRNNEQVPLLSAGVSTRRIILPVLGCACLMLTLAVLNQELIIPRIADRLLRGRDDPAGEKPLPVHGKFDRNGVHFNGSWATRKGMIIRDFTVVVPDKFTGTMLRLEAPQATFTPLAGRSGRWELTDTTTYPPRTEDNSDHEAWDTKVIETIDTTEKGRKGRYYVYTQDVDFETLTRESTTWFQRVSTWKLYNELENSDSPKLTPMAVLFHQRLTRPIMGVLLVFLGLSVILRDQNRNVIISSGLCLVLCAVFFAAQYTCKMLGDNDMLLPALAAWLPVIAFGPFGWVLFDAVHT